MAISLQQLARQGFSKERYQEPKQAFPVDVPGTVFDLTQAATTVGGQWTLPLIWTYGRIYSFGIIWSAAGGVQTIAAQMGLFINGTAVSDQSSNQFLITSVASHAKFSVSEILLNGNDLNNGSILAGPSYPTVTPGQIVTWQVVTAGTGGVSQAGYPYIMWAPNPNRA